ncbi:hypothetical protein DIPPA_54363, partial [Diplonema papillatum]
MRCRCWQSTPSVNRPQSALPQAKSITRFGVAGIRHGSETNMGRWSEPPDRFRALQLASQLTGARKISGDVFDCGRVAVPGSFRTASSDWRIHSNSLVACLLPAGGAPGLVVRTSDYYPIYPIHR